MEYVLNTIRSPGNLHDSWLVKAGRGMLMAVFIVTASLSQVFADTTAVNINTASAEALANALNGVGIAKAYRIVEYREAHGPFEAVDELIEVKGIGNALLTRNRDLIVLQ